MGAGGILCRDYDWVGVALSTDEDTGNNSILGGSYLVLAMDGDSPSVAIIMELLMEGEDAEFLWLLRCDAKEIMLIDENGSKRWQVVSLNIKESVW